MRQIFLIVLFLGFSSASKAQIFEFSSSIMPSSSISINGNSNVKSFSCSYTNPFPDVTLQHTSTLRGNKFEVVGDTLGLKIREFDCGKRGVNRDMRKTLKENEQPTINAWIERITLNEAGEAIAIMSVSIAGVTNQYEMNIDETPDSEILEIKGEQEIFLSDFKLETPSALFGLVTVDDRFVVEFELNIKQKKGSLEN
ncbi:MAG: hypothetical protein JJ895_15575 [Balneolaceae bacterium]|nr:hypothetical protein [Balneolaceae bacterium]